MTKTNIALIVGTRGFFPSHLAVEGRADMIKRLESEEINVIIPPVEATPNGVVETLEDARTYAKYFRQHSEDIQGIIVTLPNFGDELGIVETIERSDLKVPVLIHAWDDRLSEMDLPHRRDAFCGKLSVCNNLFYRKIPFTTTKLHTCMPSSPEFGTDLVRFVKICRVVSGLHGARLGLIGQRPDAFNTVRYSEKLLQASGISVSTTGIAEITASASEWPKGKELDEKIAEIKAYGAIISGTPDEHIEKVARFSLAVSNWINEKEVDATAIQCWDSIQKTYGCASCLTMSMLGEEGSPSACESDVMGSLSMYALMLASGEPSGFLDWNNNFDDDRDMCVNIHCSNYPKSFINNNFKIGNLDILGASIGKEKCFGALKGQVKAGPMTYTRITTDDLSGEIRAYVGEGEFADNPVDTVGGVAVCRVKNLQGLMSYLCENGFEHHVAMNRGLNAEVLEEAFSKYMGWKVYNHDHQS